MHAIRFGRGSLQALLVFVTLVQTSVLARQAQLTTYDDCCMQSSSWATDKGAEVYGNVKACDKDGNVLKDRPQAACGSGGGIGFTCPDMQPFEKDGILFGFAAVKGLGNANEANRACGCYETEVQHHDGTRQTLIFQATSVGGLDEANDIDLLAGTGGEGAIQGGCQKRWPGASWVKDRSFGGVAVTAASTCPMRNACVKQGCTIRNKLSPPPAVISPHKRVACPAVLPDISGCLRKDDQQFGPGAYRGNDVCLRPTKDKGPRAGPRSGCKSMFAAQGTYGSCSKSE